jgi:hypothetical protein
LLSLVPFLFQSHPVKHRILCFNGLQHHSFIAGNRVFIGFRRINHKSYSIIRSFICKIRRYFSKLPFY